MFQIVIFGDDSDYTKGCGNIMFEIVDGLAENISIELANTEEEIFQYIVGSDYNTLVCLHAEEKIDDQLNLARKIRKNNRKVELVFIAEEKYFDFQVFEVQPFYFARKGNLYEELAKMVDNYYQKYVEKTEIYQYTYNKKVYRLDVKHILYLESRGHVVHIITPKGNYKCYKKLDDMEEEFRGYSHKFIRIHKSYCVNEEAIMISSNEKVTLINGKEISVSKSRRNELKERKLKIV